MKETTVIVRTIAVTKNELKTIRSDPSISSQMLQLKSSAYE